MVQVNIGEVICEREERRGERKKREKGKRRRRRVGKKYCPEIVQVLSALGRNSVLPLTAFFRLPHRDSSSIGTHFDKVWYLWRSTRFESLWGRRKKAVRGRTLLRPKADSTFVSRVTASIPSLLPVSTSDPTSVPLPQVNAPTLRVELQGHRASPKTQPILDPGSQTGFIHLMITRLRSVAARLSHPPLPLCRSLSQVPCSPPRVLPLQVPSFSDSHLTVAGPIAHRLASRLSPLILYLLLIVVFSVFIPFIFTSPKPKPRRSQLQQSVSATKIFGVVKIERNPPPSKLAHLGVTSWPKPIIYR
ncbi:hypothetical protein ACOSP7_026676 [Xanthoceras sorbifolium]